MLEIIMHQSDSEMLLEAVVEFEGMRDQENSANTGRKSANQYCSKAV